MENKENKIKSDAELNKINNNIFKKENNEEEEEEEETIEDNEESDNLSLDNDEFKEKRNIDKSSITLNIETTSKNLNKTNNKTEKLKPLDKITIYKKLKEKEISEEEKIEINNENNDINQTEKKNSNKINLDIKSICITIFLYYSSFNFEEKDFVITQLNLNKMLKDLKMLIPEKNNLKNNKSKSFSLNSSSNNNIKGIHIYEIDSLIKKVRNKGKYLTF